MNIKLILISITLFFVGFISVIAIDSYVSHPAKIVTFQPTTPTPTPVTLLLPANALQGKLILALGTVKRMPWDKMEFEPATAGAVLYQGDEIATMTKSSTAFSITASISGVLDENTDVTLGSLLPHKITIHHKTGTGEYRTTDYDQTLSIKSLGVLTQLEQGTIKVSVENKIISIVLSSGKAKLAYIDNDNTTHMWKLTGNDTAIINDTTGKVKTTGQLLSENNQ